jgi:hypothetical protein
MSLDAIAVTLSVTNVLEQLGVPYFIGGSFASTLYGMVRTTQDSDIIADLHVENIPLMVSTLQNEFYVDAEMILDAIIHHSSCNLIHRESMFKVDIFIPRSRNFIKMQFSRARKETLSSNLQMVAYVASPEDTILAKLEWYRMGGEVSERQWRDILGVLKVQGKKVDFNYLQSMALELHVGDLLNRVLNDANINQQNP